MRPAILAAVPVILFAVACALPGLPGARYDTGWGDWESGYWESWTDTEWWDTGNDDTDETGDGDGVAIVHEVEDPACDDDGWTHSIELRGWAGSAEVWVRDTVYDPSRGERHALQTFDRYDEGGEQYEKMTLTLPIDTYVSGASTALGCDREDMLTWFYVVYDNDGDRVDCGVIGNDPEFTGTVDEGDTEAVPEGCFNFD